MGKGSEQAPEGPDEGSSAGGRGAGFFFQPLQSQFLVRTSQPFAIPGQFHIAIAAVEQPLLPPPALAGTTRSGVSRRPAGFTPPPHRPSVFLSERGRGKGGGRGTGSAGATRDPLALAAPPGAARCAEPGEMGPETSVVPTPAVSPDHIPRRNILARRNYESINK